MCDLEILSLSAVLPGTYTVATLPPASGNQARYAFVTDLGGGADMVLSDGTNWKHIRRGAVAAQAVASTITITPLSSPTIIQLSGSGFSSSSTVNLASTNLYLGYDFTLVVPAGVLATAGSLGVSLSSVPVNSLPSIAGVSANGTWADYQFNGTTIVKLRGGSL